MPRGVSVAGLEFGSELPWFCAEEPGELGEHFLQNRASTFQRLAEGGFRLFRIPCRWERLQPTLGGALNPDMVQAVRFQASLAAKYGGRIVIDVHNYGRYYAQGAGGERQEHRLGLASGGFEQLTGDHLADLWTRISYAFCGLPEIEGYGLMNEPFGLDPGAWVQASRMTVDGIRESGDATKIYVAGDRWSSAEHWQAVNPEEPWIKQSGEGIVYEAHCYFDHNASGEYELSYSEELARDPDLPQRPLKRLQPFLEWITTNKVPGFLGEFAVPTQDEDWAALLRPFLHELDAAGIRSAWWAAGDGWRDYPLAIDPIQKGAEPSPAAQQLFSCEGD